MEPNPGDGHSEEKPVTAEDLVRASEAEKQSYSDLMDSMEGSVEKKGDWFVKLGQKEDGVDNRVMILRHVDEGTVPTGARYENLADRQRKVYTLVTGRGVFLYDRIIDNQDNAQDIFMLDKVLTGSRLSEGTGLEETSTGAAIRVGYFDEGREQPLEHNISLDSMTPFSGSSDEFHMRITKSIEKAGEAEAQRRSRLLAETQSRAALANGMKNVIDGL